MEEGHQLLAEQKGFFALVLKYEGGRKQFLLTHNG